MTIPRVTFKDRTVDSGRSSKLAQDSQTKDALDWDPLELG